MSGLNSNPVVYKISESLLDIDYIHNDINEIHVDDNSRDEFTSDEIFELIRYLNDPEHPLTLEQLNVVSVNNVKVNDKLSKVDVLFTPTIPHCSMATLIGLCIRVKLIRSLPKRFKIKVKIFPGSHSQEDSVNKQLNDKERVAAALENIHLLEAVHKCLVNTDK